MTKLSVEMLMDASKAGGAAAMSSVTRLEPAGGEHALVAPAKYASGSRGTYVFETREIDGHPTKTVLIDSRSSMANRIEDGLSKGIKEGNEVLCAMPKIRVTYKNAEGDVVAMETDLDLPHRAFDGHIRWALMQMARTWPKTKFISLRAIRRSTTCLRCLTLVPLRAYWVAGIVRVSLVR